MHDIQALPTAPKTSKLAIASLVLAILAIFLSCLTGLPGLICGIIGLTKIKNSNGQLGGKGLAISGIVFSCVLSIVGIVLASALATPIILAKKYEMEAMLATAEMKQFHLIYLDARDKGSPLTEQEFQNAIDSKNLASFRTWHYSHQDADDANPSGILLLTKNHTKTVYLKYNGAVVQAPNSQFEELYNSMDPEPKEFRILPSQH